MSLKTPVTITYEEHQSLCNVVNTLEHVLKTVENAVSDTRRADLKSQLDLSRCVLAEIASELYKAYQSLPDGNHLKLVYADKVWTLDDTDLA